MFLNDLLMSFLFFLTILELNVLDATLGCYFLDVGWLLLGILGLGVCPRRCSGRWQRRLNLDAAWKIGIFCQETTDLKSDWCGMWIAEFHIKIHQDPSMICMLSMVSSWFLMLSIFQVPVWSPWYPYPQVIHWAVWLLPCTRWEIATSAGHFFGPEVPFGSGRIWHQFLYYALSILRKNEMMISIQQRSKKVDWLWKWRLYGYKERILSLFLKKKLGDSHNPTENLQNSHGFPTKKPSPRASCVSVPGVTPRVMWLAAFLCPSDQRWDFPAKNRGRIRIVFTFFLLISLKNANKKYRDL